MYTMTLKYHYQVMQKRFDKRQICQKPSSHSHLSCCFCKQAMLYPLLAPWVLCPQMVRGCTCVCVCVCLYIYSTGIVWNELI